MAYGISYIYEWLMVFVNGCISEVERAIHIYE